MGVLWEKHHENTARLALLNVPTINYKKIGAFTDKLEVLLSYSDFFFLMVEKLSFFKHNFVRGKLHSFLLLFFA